MSKLPAEGGRGSHVWSHDASASERVRRGARKLGPYIVVAAVLLALVVGMMVFFLLRQDDGGRACPPPTGLGVVVVRY